MFTGWPQPEPKLVVVVEIHAHRAGPLREGIAVHAEQTLPAFARTWSDQRVVCELDVRFTADGVAVVFHDPDLRRMTGTRGRVHELDAAAFRALRTRHPGHRAAASSRRPRRCRSPRSTRCSGWPAATGPGSTSSSRTCPGSPGSTPRRRRPNGSPRVLRGSRIAPERLTVQTFWAPDLAVFTRLLPEVRRSLLVEPGAEARGIEWALMAGAGALGLAWPVSPEAVRRAHDHGLAVMGYTLNEPAAVREAWRAGLDVIITDDPAMAQRALAGATLATRASRGPRPVRRRGVAARGATTSGPPR